MTNGALSKEEQAWLVEYQALQSDVNSSGSSYWTVAGVFIGMSSVFLGLVYGVMTNKDLYQMWLKRLQGEPSEIQPLQTVITVVGILIVLMLSFVRLWLRRITFLQQINYERMRDIERQLGMWKSWRVHGVDHWNMKACNFDDEIVDKGRLTSYRPRDWWCNWRGYARPGGYYYDGSFAVLIFLWLFLIFTVSAPMTLPLSAVGIIIIGIADYFVIRFTRVHPRSKKS